MAIQKIKVGDLVQVLTGKSKGKTGKVLSVVHKTSRVVVEGVNIIKKHMKPNPNKNEQGGIVEKESTIHVSNVALVNPATNKADRVGIKVLNDGKKVRYFKSNNEVLDN